MLMIYDSCTSDLSGVQLLRFFKKIFKSKNYRITLPCLPELEPGILWFTEMAPVGRVLKVPGSKSGELTWALNCHGFRQILLYHSSYLHVSNSTFWFWRDFIEPFLFIFLKCFMHYLHILKLQNSRPGFRFYFLLHYQNE